MTEHFGVDPCDSELQRESEKDELADKSRGLFPKVSENNKTPLMLPSHLSWLEEGNRHLSPTVPRSHRQVSPHEFELQETNKARYDVHLSVELYSTTVYCIYSDNTSGARNKFVFKLYQAKSLYKQGLK